MSSIYSCYAAKLSFRQLAKVRGRSAVRTGSRPSLTHFLVTPLTRLVKNPPRAVAVGGTRLFYSSDPGAAQPLARSTARAEQQRADQITGSYQSKNVPTSAPATEAASVSSRPPIAPAATAAMKADTISRT
ncbi:hypothetical protein Rleg5DRAFT_1299 [Rhizobium leguminosarum bv. viciae WSM1455]|nr:hypothetical protein Rleg5DRAFT_1299 [Rhizobium leguminosarum bv. viciae WSM1455]